MYLWDSLSLKLQLLQFNQVLDYCVLYPFLGSFVLIGIDPWVVLGQALPISLIGSSDRLLLLNVCSTVYIACSLVHSAYEYACPEYPVTAHYIGGSSGKHHK